jgi:hypothetical protein
MNRKVTRTALTAVCSAAFLSIPATTAGQSADDAFETLRLDLSLVANVNRNTFHDYWSPSPGAELAVETPFHFGTVEAGLHYGTFDGMEPAQPDFDSFFLFLGWGYDWSMTPRLSWYNGLRLGSMLLKFDTPRGGLDEQEFGIGLGSRLRYGIAGGWSIDLSARYRVVFTHERLRLFFVAGGISRSFKTPRCLKEFLE